MSHELIFNNDYREQAKLSNENKILLRLIHANDKPHIMKAFEQLSSDSRQKRFFGAKKILSDNELSYFTEVDQFDHFAMAAMELNDKNEEICLAGITRFIRLPTDPECAEVGITVVDREQGTGIGRLLIERMFCAATERGINRLRFECLAENLNMQRLVNKLNVNVKFVREYELLIAEIDIPKPCSDTNQYSVDIIEEISDLIRLLSSEAFILYTDFSFGLFKRAIDQATKYKIQFEKRIKAVSGFDKSD